MEREVLETMKEIYTVTQLVIISSQIQSQINKAAFI